MENLEKNTNMQDDEISLRDLILKIKEIWLYLLGKWKLILVVGLLGGALGLTLSLVKETKYEAELSFSVIEKSSSGGGLSALAGQFGLNMGGNESVFSGANIIELLQSRTLIERTLLTNITYKGEEDRLINYYLKVNPIEFKEGQVPIDYPKKLRREEFSREQDSLLNVLQEEITKKRLKVTKGSKDVSIINISFTNEDEFFSKNFTEILIREVSEFYVQTKTQTTRINLETMQKRADSTRNEYEKALIGRAVFADQNLNMAKQLVGVDLQKYQTNIQLMGTAYAELVKNIEILKLDLIRETPLIQVIDMPILPLKKDRLGKAKGIILGGFLAGFLIVSYLLGQYFYRGIMSEE